MTSQVSNVVNPESTISSFYRLGTSLQVPRTTSSRNPVPEGQRRGVHEGHRRQRPEGGLGSNLRRPGSHRKRHLLLQRLLFLAHSIPKWQKFYQVLFPFISVFSKQFKVDTLYNQKILADEGIRSVDLEQLKRWLCLLSHNHGPMSSTFCFSFK